ncbi:MAG: maltokinase [Actinomycetota bacterium]|nr:maltokinase [Actinomycetota bacterium]
MSERRQARSMLDLKSLGPILPSYLARQRWYAGDDEPSSVKVVDEMVVRAELPAVVDVVVDADGRLYQLLVGLRAIGDEVPDFLNGSDYAVLGHVGSTAGHTLAYDALIDSELCLVLLDEVSGGTEKAEWVRPVTAEQSNTSVVFEDRLILKFLRRLSRGINPETEVTTALDQVGFNHIAAPLAVWQRDGFDLALLQPFLAGGTEGWALALASLRDLYSSGGDPAAAGGDFASESERLGAMTGRMHVALAEAFGAESGDAAGWAAAMMQQLDRVAPKSPWRSGVRAAFAALARLAEPGVATRVHGDFHLAQVMRMETGWFVLDFEGEPSRPLEERRRQYSPLKDVAGMLRSLHYASQVALMERDQGERPTLSSVAAAWEERNRQAFLDGFREAKGIDDLLPRDEEGFNAVLLAFELDKAVYELAYERDHRPDWANIPLQAIRRAVGA